MLRLRGTHGAENRSEKNHAQEMAYQGQNSTFGRPLAMAPILALQGWCYSLLLSIPDSRSPPATLQASAASANTTSLP